MATQTEIQNIFTAIENLYTDNHNIKAEKARLAGASGMLEQARRQAVEELEEAAAEAKLQDMN